ncbi:MAG: MBOAT family protein [Bacteroidetes bacterium]|nr:MBOAT family protein [Bacteroidota bacterium]
MFFNSFEFAVFLPIVFALYWLNTKVKYQNILIFIASYIFYGWWDWRFVGLLMLSTLIDYGSGFLVAGDGKYRKTFLWVSLANNLLVLGIFKYYNFFSAELSHLLNAIGFHIHPYILNIVLPVGISFYTFHGMSYVIDIYRKNINPEKSFIDYAMFVSFFPLLVAGPIERAAHLLPQIKQQRKFNYKQGVEGLRLILYGLIKKVVIADTLSPIVDDIFGNYNNYSGSTLILGAVYFAFQIYGDFSGYSDIAIGTAKLFGFELLSNFKFPYFSRDIAEFWRRWHISLSSWFRDYVYIPLGGSRRGKAIAVRNTMIIFLISGFWHGAKWNFIVWGGIHALGFLPILLLGHNRKNVNTVVAENKGIPGAKDIMQMVFTFLFVTLAWIFFRATDITTAIGYISAMKTHLFTMPLMKSFLFVYILPFLIVDWNFRRDERVLPMPSNKLLRYSIYIVSIFLILDHCNSNASFIYFQF